jgi:hypothetical protein
VRFIPAIFSVVVDRSIAAPIKRRRTQPIDIALLSLETLQTRPCFEQRSIHNAFPIMKGPDIVDKLPP